MEKRTRSRVLPAVMVILAGGVALALWVGFSLGPEPEIVIRSEFDGVSGGGEHPVLGPSTDLTVEVREPRGGVGGVRIEVEQNGQTRTVEETESPWRSAWTPWRRPPRPELELTWTLDRETLAQGEAVVRVIATRSSGFLRFPGPQVVERSFTVRLTPPSLAVRSTTHYVAQGGCEVVVYQVGEGTATSGVRAGDWFFPGYQLPDGGPQDRFAIFAVPYDVDMVEAVRLEAADEVGNRAQARFIDRFFSRPPGTDTARLSDSFLQRVVPDILSRTPELRSAGDVMQDYLQINRDLRRANRAELRELAGKTQESFLWQGPFLSLSNSLATAGFAERRTYLYEGQEVDTQDHLGFDLASVARAPVQAANDGIVLKAGWFGIYGDAVVLDHGFGLLTLYGHLSSIAVAEGDRVERGQEIGRTGMTGLAGGDHLHFAVVLQGLPVNPREWWDGHWIQDRLRLKLGAALPGPGGPSAKSGG